MSETTCPGCQERDAVITALLRRVGQLEQRVRELEARLGRNVSNSSIPPGILGVGRSGTSGLGLVQAAG
jgi:hypothetical protein